MLNHSIYANENDKTCIPHIVCLLYYSSEECHYLLEHIPINCCIGVKFNYYPHMVKHTNEYHVA